MSTKYSGILSQNFDISLIFFPFEASMQFRLDFSNSSINYSRTCLSGLKGEGGVKFGLRRGIHDAEGTSRTRVAMATVT